VDVSLPVGVCRRAQGRVRMPGRDRAHATPGAGRLVVVRTERQRAAR
jgi:hypothetical protein